MMPTLCLVTDYAGNRRLEMPDGTFAATSNHKVSWTPALGTAQ